MFIKNLRLVAVFTGLLLALPGVKAHALESNAVTSKRAHVTVISDVDAIEPGKPFHIGLRFRLTKGWHVYWSNPGDAGQPPAIHLHARDGIEVSGIEWPTPVRLPEGPAMVFAYTGDMALPLTVTPSSSVTGDFIKISADADWLVCAKFCVPEKGHFDLSIPIGKTKTSAQAPLIAAGLARVPQASPFSAQITDKATIIVNDPLLSAKTVSAAWFFPDTWGAIVHSAPQELDFSNDGIKLNLKPGPVFKPDASLSGILVLKDAGGRESYYNITASPESLAGNSGSDWASFLFFALLGGLILNLMPCVFPILAMKALSLARLSGAERRHVRSQAIFYTVGVLTAFVVLDLLLLGLRAAGEAVGWGFQFQSPVFVTAMAWLLFALGLNLSGVYAVGVRLMGAGESYAGRKGAAGSFFTGLLAVIVATPCVAPFLGAAIAAALTASAGGMMAIFIAMGIGLSLPYALLALFPGAMRILPRPGKWMEILRQALAFPMYGASAWLLWVLSRQDGDEGLAYALAGLIVLAFAAWLYGQVRGHIVSRALIVATLLMAGVFLYQVMELPLAKTSAAPHSGPNEEPFTPARLAELQSADTPVFVDMTAAWCITCLVNEQVAISSDAVRAAFARDRIVYMKGDWTQQDPAITSFLKQHGSDGVPLYVYYPAHHGTPVSLPQILTPSIILDTINRSTS